MTMHDDDTDTDSTETDERITGRPDREGRFAAMEHFRNANGNRMSVGFIEVPDKRCPDQIVTVASLRFLPAERSEPPCTLWLAPGETSRLLGALLAIRERQTPVPAPRPTTPRRDESEPLPAGTPRGKVAP